jgi:hypothetical protein
MGDGIQIGRLYASWVAEEHYNGIGFDIGFMDIENDDGSIADSFSISIKISHFVFAIGVILKEYG